MKRARKVSIGRPSIEKPSKKSFVVYSRVRYVGGGLYGPQPCISFAVEGANGSEERDGLGLVVALPWDEIGLNPDFGERYRVTLERLPDDPKLHREGLAEVRVYEKHLAKYKRRVQRARAAERRRSR